MCYMDELNNKIYNKSLKNSKKTPLFFGFTAYIGRKIPKKEVKNESIKNKIIALKI